MRAWPHIASLCPVEITKVNVNIPVKDGKTTLLKIAVSLHNEGAIVQLLNLGARLPEGFDGCFYHFGFNPSNSRIRVVTLLLNAYCEQYGMEKAKKIASDCIGSFTPALYTNYEVHDLFVACVHADVLLKFLVCKLCMFLMPDESMVEPTFAMLETTRRRAIRCTSTLVALLGCCGRWRKVRGGTLRDASQSIVKRVWETRRMTQQWDEVIEKERKMKE